MQLHYRAFQSGGACRRSHADINAQGAQKLGFVRFLKGNCLPLGGALQISDPRSQKAKYLRERDSKRQNSWQIINIIKNCKCYFIFIIKIRRKHFFNKFKNPTPT